MGVPLLQETSTWSYRLKRKRLIGLWGDRHVSDTQNGPFKWSIGSFRTFAGWWFQAPLQILQWAIIPNWNKNSWNCQLLKPPSSVVCMFPAMGGRHLTRKEKLRNRLVGACARWKMKKRSKVQSILCSRERERGRVTSQMNILEGHILADNISQIIQFGRYSSFWQIILFWKN